MTRFSGTRSTALGPRVSTLAATALLAGLLAPVAPRAQAVAEPALKAAYLLNFARYTEWPATPSTAAHVFCTGDADVETALRSAAAGKVIDQRPLEVKRLARRQAADGCGVLYAGRLDRDGVASLVGSLQSASVLTVGDGPHFATGGGVIEFYVEDGRLRFAVNLTAAEAAQLKLRAPLLSLARIVK